MNIMASDMWPDAIDYVCKECFFVIPSFGLSDPEA